jgi:sporulation protein YlmC with PRC-barrel domain
MDQHGANERLDTLHRLKDTGLTLDDVRQDIRGFKVIDRDGHEIGHVSGLFIDEAERKLRMIEVSAGGFLGIGERHVLLPVDAITAVDGHVVHIDQSGEHVAKSPAYDPSIVTRPPASYWEPFYGYYGLSPYWNEGYFYPQFPFATGEQSYPEFVEGPDPRHRDPATPLL